jgi:endonuclease YncB( thermonuclease family)
MTKLILSTTIFLFITVPALAFEARVVSIQDGDTITVQTEQGGKPVRVRLYGIDCPERKQPFGNRARQATAEAVMGKDVNIHQVDKKDRYGRTVAIVAAPGREALNSWLVKEGLAWVYPQFCKRADPCDRLRALEQEARAAKRSENRQKRALPLREREEIQTFLLNKGATTLHSLLYLPCNR